MHVLRQVREVVTAHTKNVSLQVNMTKRAARLKMPKGQASIKRLVRQVNQKIMLPLTPKTNSQERKKGKVALKKALMLCLIK